MSYILAGILWNDDGTMATATTKDPLEALEELRYRITNFNGKFHNYNELMGTIEAALLRLKGYENHTTFTMVNQINTLRDENDELRKRLNEMYELREQYHLDQTKLKALEIIKEKNVDITTLLDCHNAKEYNRWNSIRSHYSHPPIDLTQEEYDLLKEVLL